MNGSKKENNTGKHLQSAMNLSFEKLKAMDTADVASRAGATLHEEDEGKRVIQIHYLGKPVRITAPA